MIDLRIVRRRALATIVLSAILMCGITLAKKEKPPAPPSDLSSALITLFSQEKAAIDQEIIDLAQKRGDLPSKQPLLEFQIDLRVIQRALLDKAAETAPGPERTNLLLRQMELANVTARIDSYLSQTPVALTNASAGGLRALHDGTYKLDKVTTTKQVDELCNGLGIVILNLVGQGDMKTVPLMRPKTDKPARPAVGHSKQNHPLTLHDHAEEARNAAASPTLHRQLAALADAAEAAVAPGANDPDAQLLAQTLVDSVALVNGVRDLPMVETTRDRILSMLNDGLTLFVDVRTRKDGITRLDQLAAYRRAMEQIGHLSLPKDLSQSLGPAMAWATQNPHDGAGVIDAIGRYVDLTNHFDQQPPLGPLPPAYQKAMDDLNQGFAKHRAAFVDDSTHLDDGTTTSTGPQQLDLHDQELARIIEAEDLISKLPGALDALSAFKPRPAMGIERHVTTAVTAMSSTIKSPIRGDAQQFLKEIVKLAGLAKRLAALHPDDLPADVVKIYAGTNLPRFEARWRLLMTDLCNTAATSGAIDETKAAKLQSAVELSEALPGAAAIQSVITRLAVLSRWLDFMMTQPEIQSLIEPYQTATLAAFGGFVADESNPIERWSALRARYQPILNLLSNAATNADACADLPEGLQGDSAALMTPLDNQPYFAERHASVELALWSHFMSNNDAEDAQQIFEQLSNDLK